jgi:RNA recognition motif-containing protein
MNIYVGNLPFRLSEDEIMELFAAYGEVTKVNLISDRDTGRAKGFGFVEMADDEAGREAIEALNESEVGGRNIKVNEARPRENGRGGNGGGGRRPQQRNRW